MASLALLLLLVVFVSSTDAFTAPLRASSSSFATARSAATLEAPPTKNSNDAVPAAEIPLAPLTQWGQPYDDIVAVQEAAKKVTLPAFAQEISALSLGIADDIEAQKAYFRDNRAALLQQMQDHACLVFRNFSLMTTPDGFCEFYNALQMKVCLDPLHSVAARPTVAMDGSSSSTSKSPIYEAVNKESRKNFFIGMHNEFVGTRAPAAAAFVCFTAAEKGGEFLVADGRRIFRQLPRDLLQLLYSKQIRYSVMELPFFDWLDSLPGLLREPLAGAVRGLVATAVNAKVDFAVDLQWIGDSNYDTANARTLQARAPVQPPIVPHPVTGDPTWFCNVHSHSSLLRSQREEMCVYCILIVSIGLFLIVSQQPHSFPFLAAVTAPSALKTGPAASTSRTCILATIRP